MNASRLLVGLAGLSVAGVASAATIDGTKDASYGAALAVQTVQTQFGDNASEWNAGYATIDAGKLNLMLTGNLENNFNKLSIWIDSTAGGQSTFTSAGNDDSNRMNGLVFDTPFTADYHLIARRGGSKLDLDFADLGAGTFTFHEDVFGGSDAGSGVTGTGVNSVGIGVAYDGSNTAGILGGTGAADATAALAVNTGLEIQIDLADLGYTGGNINIMVGQNGSGHDFFSNQFLGGLQAPQSNLGGDGLGNFTGTAAIDFTTFAGDQFFTVPEPATAALLGLGGLAMLRRRQTA